MSEALRKTWRLIVFSICEWGTNKPWKWRKGTADLWRATEDIVKNFDEDIYWGGLSFLSIIDKQM